MSQDYYAILVQPPSQSEAETGSNNNKPMTPLRTKQAFAEFLTGTAVDMSGTQQISLLGKAGEQPGVFYETLIGNGDGLPGILTNGYISINPSAYPLGVNIAGEVTYMFGIATDVAANPMIVLKADTGKIIKCFGGDNTNVMNVEADGEINISSSGQTEVKFSAQEASFTSLSWNFGVGINAPLSKLHVVGTASNSTPIARFIGANAGEDAFIRLGLDSGSAVEGWDFIRDYATGDLQLYCSQTFCNVVLLNPADSTGRVGIGEAVPDYKLDVNGAIGFTPGSSVTPVDNGDVVFELTNNTTLTIRAKGSDGTVRSGTVTLS
jgi:hypothetical protein